MSSRIRLRVGDPFVKCFVPKGRTSFVIYAVSVRDHPDWTKVGKTARWQNRRRAYDFWNLAPGDAVLNFQTFTFIEDWVDLDRIELQVLAELPFAKAFGKEWFAAPFEEVAPTVERIIDGMGLSYM